MWVAENIWRIQNIEKIAEIDLVRNLSKQKQGQLIDLTSDEELKREFEQNSLTEF